MATALQNNPDLECSICFDCFKTPKIISCGHSFCLNCLVRYIDGRKGSFPCPVCKHDVQIPRGGVKRFLTNFSLQTVTNSLRTTDILTPQPSTILKPKHYCPNHSKKEVEYYCQTCNLGLCSKCIYRDHNDHKTLDLECDSTREMVVNELSNYKPFAKNKLEDLEKTHVTLLETSKKLKSLCDEACTEISAKTEQIIADLRKHCKKRQKDIKRHFEKNDLQLTETRQKVVTQIKNIKTDLERSTTEEPTLTLINSLTKLKDLQKLCENMQTDIPPVTYVKWRQGSAKVCDILGSTETKPLHTPIARTVFKLNYKDIEVNNEVKCFSEDKYTSHGLVWSCRVYRHTIGLGVLHIDIVLLPEDNPKVHYCEIQVVHTVTVINEDKDKNVVIKDTEYRTFPNYGLRGMGIFWGYVIDPSAGFIDNEGNFYVRFDLLEIPCITYSIFNNGTYCRIL